MAVNDYRSMDSSVPRSQFQKSKPISDAIFNLDNIPTTMSKELQVLSNDGAFDVSFVPHTDFDAVRELIAKGVDLLEKKDGEYGASWCKRGGTGAFFTVWRKIDRLEEQLKKVKYNLLDISVDTDSTESLDETLKDAMLYFALVLEKRAAFRATRQQLLGQIPPNGK